MTKGSFAVLIHHRVARRKVTAPSGASLVAADQGHHHLHDVVADLVVVVNDAVVVRRAGRSLVAVVIDLDEGSAIILHCRLLSYNIFVIGILHIKQSGAKRNESTSLL